MPADPSPDTTPIIPQMAAAVVTLRDGADGLEVLVGQRTFSAKFMGGVWVFPGGRVEPSDGPGDAGWRAAAARELREEVGVSVRAEDLEPFDRWLTPEPFPRRFDTAFYLARVPGDVSVVIDGEEIIASRWATPDQLLQDAADGTAAIAFPTLRQLEALREWPTAQAALAACHGRTLTAVTPKLGDVFPARND